MVPKLCEKVIRTGKEEYRGYEPVRVDVSVSSIVGAGAIVIKRGEVVAADSGVLPYNSGVAGRSVCAKPGGIFRGG